jgi:hypothetical protein
MNTQDRRGRDCRVEVDSIDLGRPDKLLGAVLAVLALVIYLATPLQVHNQIIDSSNFAAAIQRAGVSDKWFYGDHLVYVFLLNWLYHSLVHVFPDLQALRTAQVFNSLMAGLGVGAFYFLARAFVKERWLAVGLALTLLFTYQYWLFATDVEVHAPTGFFYIVSLLFACRISPERRLSAYVALGMLSAIAVLFHVITALFVPLIAALILIGASVKGEKPMGSKGGVGVRLLAYVGTTAACVAVPYWYVAEDLFHLATWREIYLWLLPNFGEGTDVGATSIWSAITLAARRIPFAFVGRVMWIATPAVRLMPGQSCLDASRYLVRNVSSVAAVMLVCCGLLACALVAALGIVSIPGLVRLVRTRSVAAIALIAWLVGYGILIGVFMPGSSEHWGVYWWPGFLLLVGEGLSATLRLLERRRRAVVALGGAMLFLLIIGNGGSVAVQAQPGNDLYVERMSWYRANTAAADLVIDGGDWMWTGYLEYYLQARVIPLRTWMAQTGYEEGLQVLEGVMRETKGAGGRVFLTEDALERDACSERITEEEAAFFRSFEEAMRPRISCLQSTGESVCEVVNW